MDLAELKNIVSRGEDSCHQFKEDIRNADSLAAELVAFSNSKGGQLLIGVSNDGELTGLSREDVGRLNQLIGSAASQHVRSPIAVETKNIATETGRTIIVVTVAEGTDKPYFDHQGVIWLKNGSDKRRINSKEKLRRLFQEADLLHADETPVRAGIESLDENLLSGFLKATYQETFPDSPLEKIRLLENMNLANNRQLNLAGLLLFGKKPELYKPECIIKAVYFPWSEISDWYLDSEDFTGPLQAVFQKALDFIIRNLRKVQNQKSVNSTGDLEVPRIVFEELLVNALIHRDYFICAPIKMFIFENRIEIISPGNLPNHLTIEKIRAGNSVLRNPILASFAAKGLLPYRGLGTGVRRVLQDWPHIQFVDDREGCTFTSVIERKSVENKGSLKGHFRLREDPLTEVQEAIVTIVRNDPKVSYEKISTQLGKDRSTVKRNLQRLKVKKILTRAGSKKTGEWVLNED